jgi:hypothetical protein
VGSGAAAVKRDATSRTTAAISAGSTLAGAREAVRVVAILALLTWSDCRLGKEAGRTFGFEDIALIRAALSNDVERC